MMTYSAEPTRIKWRKIDPTNPLTRARDRTIGGGDGRIFPVWVGFYYFGLGPLPEVKIVG
jgi:hypothetical protein